TFKKPTLGVDTHIFRVSHRLQLSNGKTPEKVEEDLMKIIPTEHIGKMHQWIVLHGRYICKARKPLCDQCPIKSLCNYHIKKITK
ncbi:MAG: endonuclease III, partial [Pseudomonadota bacterium]